MIRWIDARYRRYVERYRAYLKLRGYGDHLADGPFATSVTTQFPHASSVSV